MPSAVLQSGDFISHDAAIRVFDNHIKTDVHEGHAPPTGNEKPRLFRQLRAREASELASAASPRNADSMYKPLTKLKEEFFALLPPTIFFFVALNIVRLVRLLLLEGTGISTLSWISVAVAALILGKAVLIADLLPMINRFPDKPLIYNVAWKTMIYLVVSFVIHYLERLIDFRRQTGGFVAGNEKLLAEMVWPHFWAIQIILFVLIIMYCTLHELVRVIGKEKVLRIFFGPMPIPQV
jgi:hypothetical protein